MQAKNSFEKLLNVHEKTKEIGLVHSYVRSIMDISVVSFLSVRSTSMRSPFGVLAFLLREGSSRSDCLIDIMGWDVSSGSITTTGSSLSVSIPDASVVSESEEIMTTACLLAMDREGVEGVPGFKIGPWVCAIEIGESENKTSGINKRAIMQCYLGLCLSACR